MIRRFGNLNFFSLFFFLSPILRPTSWAQNQDNREIVDPALKKMAMAPEIPVEARIFFAKAKFSNTQLNSQDLDGLRNQINDIRQQTLSQHFSEFLKDASFNESITNLKKGTVGATSSLLQGAIDVALPSRPKSKGLPAVLTVMNELSKKSVESAERYFKDQIEKTPHQIEREYLTHFGAEIRKSYQNILEIEDPKIRAQKLVKLESEFTNIINNEPDLSEEKKGQYKEQLQEQLSFVKNHEDKFTEDSASPQDNQKLFARMASIDNQIAYLKKTVVRQHENQQESLKEIHEKLDSLTAQFEQWFKDSSSSFQTKNGAQKNIDLSFELSHLEALKLLGPKDQAELLGNPELFPLLNGSEKGKKLVEAVKQKLKEESREAQTLAKQAGELSLEMAKGAQILSWVFSQFEDKETAETFSKIARVLAGLGGAAVKIGAGDYLGAILSIFSIFTGPDIEELRFQHLCQRFDGLDAKLDRVLENQKTMMSSLARIEIRLMSIENRIISFENNTYSLLQGIHRDLSIANKKIDLLNSKVNLSLFSSFDSCPQLYLSLSSMLKRTPDDSAIFNEAYSEENKDRFKKCLQFFGDFEIFLTQPQAPLNLGQVLLSSNVNFEEQEGLKNSYNPILYFYLNKIALTQGEEAFNLAWEKYSEKLFTPFILRIGHFWAELKDLLLSFELNRLYETNTYTEVRWKQIESQYSKLDLAIQNSLTKAQQQNDLFAGQPELFDQMTLVLQTENEKDFRKKNDSTHLYMAPPEQNEIDQQCLAQAHDVEDIKNVVIDRYDVLCLLQKNPILKENYLIYLLHKKLIVESDQFMRFCIDSGSASESDMNCRFKFFQGSNLVKNDFIQNKFLFLEAVVDRFFPIVNELQPSSRLSRLTSLQSHPEVGNFVSRFLVATLKFKSQTELLTKSLKSLDAGDLNANQPQQNLEELQKMYDDLVGLYTGLIPLFGELEHASVKEPLERIKVPDSRGSVSAYEIASDLKKALQNVNQTATQLFGRGSNANDYRFDPKAPMRWTLVFSSYPRSVEASHVEFAFDLPDVLKIENRLFRPHPFQPELKKIVEAL